MPAPAPTHGSGHPRRASFARRLNDGDRLMLTPQTGKLLTWNNGYEYTWDIPEDLPEGPATLAARAFAQTITGFEEVAASTIDVELQHSDNNPPTGNGSAEAETVELTWPTQNGPIGFYKGGATWRAYVDAQSTGRAQGPTGPDQDTTQLFYTTTSPGLKPVWNLCASPGVVAVRGTCALANNHTMSQVKALGITVREDQNPSPGVGSPFTLESGDAHRFTRELAVLASQCGVALRFNTAIAELIKPGQEIVVQVVKDPLKTKGARLSMQLSIAGRYLVYMPQGAGVGAMTGGGTVDKPIGRHRTDRLRMTVRADGRAAVAGRPRPAAAVQQPGHRSRPRGAHPRPAARLRSVQPRRHPRRRRDRRTDSGRCRRVGTARGRSRCDPGRSRVSGALGPVGYSLPVSHTPPSSPSR